MRRLLASSFLILTASFPASNVRDRRYELDPALSTVWFDADATLGQFTGRSTRLTGWLEFADPPYNNVHAHIELEAASLQTGIGRRDRHMREELETDKYPRIIVDVDSTRADTANYHFVWARLTVRGRSTPIMTYAHATERGDTVFVRGRLPTRFTDLGMKPPTRMVFGALKVRNDFTINFDCAFHRNE